MTPEQYERASRLFLRLADVDRSQHAAAMDLECADDPEVRDAVAAMLREDSSPGGRGESRGGELDLNDGVHERLLASLEPSSIPERFGPFRIIRLIGEGGMGMVFEAEQDQPRRPVALKVLRTLAGPALWSAASVRALAMRFEREVALLGTLEHPGIARIYHAGVEEAPTPTGGVQGIAYFAMELVRGRTLITHAAAHRLGLRERVELLVSVCDAVQHAHQKGVTHRDLKPGNIIVSEADGRPKVLDFGIARTTASGPEEERAATMTGATQIIGTLAYMSPEQAAGGAHDVDTRSDVYSLGVILHELLTGRPLLDVSSLPLARAVRTILEEEPAPASRGTLWDGAPATALRGDLDAIIAKATQKDRERRYAGAAQLADDLRRHLAHEPIAARSLSGLDKALRFARRHRVPVGAAALLVIAMAAGTIGTTWGFITAAHKAELAGEAEARAERRADELERVATFQAAQLADINPASMGLDLRRSIREERRESLERAGADDAAVRAAMEELGTALAGVNFTDVARASLRASIFDRTLHAIDEQFAQQPLVRARLLQTVAETLVMLGLPDRAEGPQATALRIRDELLGGDDPRTLESVAATGIVLQSQGRYDEAEGFYRRALEGRRRVLGDDHPKTLAAIADMGYFLKSRGDLSAAEPFYLEALGGYKRVLGDDDPATLMTMNNLAALRSAQARLEEAEEMYRLVLERRRRLLGPDDPDLLRSVQNLGSVLRRLRMMDEAEPLYREALAGRRRVLGDEHPETLVSINNMGVLLQTLGRFEEAEQFQRECMEARRRLAGPEHPDTLFSMYNLGVLVAEQGRWEEAIDLYRESTEGFLHAFGDETWQSASARLGRGLALTELGRWDEAEEELTLAERVMSTAQGVPRGRYERCVRAIAALGEARAASDGADNAASPQ